MKSYNSLSCKRFIQIKQLSDYNKSNNLFVFLKKSIKSHIDLINLRQCYKKHEATLVLIKGEPAGVLISFKQVKHLNKFSKKWDWIGAKANNTITLKDLETIPSERVPLVFNNLHLPIPQPQLFNNLWRSLNLLKVR